MRSMHSSSSESEDLTDSASESVVSSFDPALKARATHSAGSERRRHISMVHHPPLTVSSQKNFSPKDSRKKPSNFAITFLSKLSFPRKVSNVLPSTVVPSFRLKVRLIPNTRCRRMTYASVVIFPPSRGLGPPTMTRTFHPVCFAIDSVAT